MPIQSTLAQAIAVFEHSYSFPTEAELRDSFGTSETGGVDYSKQSEATLQMIFSGKYKLHLPQKCLDAEILESGAYQVLSRSFYELIKNSLDSHSSQFDLIIFKDEINKEVEVVAADKGCGFRAGKFAEHFHSEETIVKFQDLTIPGKNKLSSDKQRGKSLGGAGMGLIGINRGLKEVGGFLALQSTEEFPAILRLKSSYAVDTEDLSDLDLMAPIIMLTEEVEAAFQLRDEGGEEKGEVTPPPLKKVSDEEKEEGTVFLVKGVSGKENINPSLFYSQVFAADKTEPVIDYAAADPSHKQYFRERQSSHPSFLSACQDNGKRKLSSSVLPVSSDLIKKNK